MWLACHISNSKVSKLIFDYNPMGAKSVTGNIHLIHREGKEDDFINGLVIAPISQEKKVRCNIGGTTVTTELLKNKKNYIKLTPGRTSFTCEKPANESVRIIFSNSFSDPEPINLPSKGDLDNKIARLKEELLAAKRVPVNSCTNDKGKFGKVRLSTGIHNEDMTPHGFGINIDNLEPGEVYVSKDQIKDIEAIDSGFRKKRWAARWLCQTN